MRREFLKGYLLKLLAEGDLRATDRPAEMLGKVLSRVPGDLAGVAAEAATACVEQGARHLGDAIRDKLDGFARAVGEGGLATAWADMQAAYQRGLDLQARKR